MSVGKENRVYALPNKRKNEKDIYHRKHFTVRKLGLLERDEYGCASIYTCAFCCCAFSFDYAQLREHIERAHPQELRWFPHNPQMLVNYRVFGKQYKRNEYVLTDRMDKNGAPVWNHLPRPVEVDEADDEVLVDGHSPGQHFIPAVGHAPMEHFRGERRNVREREPVYRFPAPIDKQWAKEQLKELHKIVEEQKKTRASRSLKRTSWSARRREPNSADRKGGEKRRRLDSDKAAAATTPRARRTEVAAPKSAPLVKRNEDRESARKEKTTPRSSRVTKRQENDESVSKVDKGTQQEKATPTARGAGPAKKKEKEKCAAARTMNETDEPRRSVSDDLTSGGEMGTSQEAVPDACVEHYEQEALKEDGRAAAAAILLKDASLVEKMKVGEMEGEMEQEGHGDGYGVAPKETVEVEECEVSLSTIHLKEASPLERTIEEEEQEERDGDGVASKEKVQDTEVMAESDQPMDESENGIDLGGLDSTKDSNKEDLEDLERNVESFRVEETPEAEQGEMMELIMHGPLLEGEQGRREREGSGDAMEMDGEEKEEDMNMLPPDHGGEDNAMVDEVDGEREENMDIPPSDHGEEDGAIAIMDGDWNGEPGDEASVGDAMEEGGEKELLHILAHGPLEEEEEEEDGDSLASGGKTGKGSGDYSDSADTSELDEEEVDWMREREQERRDMDVLRGDWIVENERGRTYAPPEGWEKDDEEGDDEEEKKKVPELPNWECEKLVKECKEIQIGITLDQRREYEEAKKMNDESKKKILEEFRAAAIYFPGLGGDVLGALEENARGEEGDAVIRKQSRMALKKEKERVKKCEEEKGEDSDSEGWVTASEGEEEGVTVGKEKEQSADSDETEQGDGEGMEETMGEEQQSSVLTGEE